MAFEDQDAELNSVAVQDEEETTQEQDTDDEKTPLLDGLTPELEKKLISLIEEVERESYPVWRFLNRDFFEAESFW